jgi:TRAP-type C4-dicarboxylate transport system permease small subunit
MSTDIPHRDTSYTQDLLLWISILGGPIAWLLHFQINYTLVPHACRSGHRITLYACTAVFLVLALICALIGWSMWRESSDQMEDDQPVSRASFMAAVGMLSGLMFALTIVAQGLATIMLNPCQD